ncbi:MAG: peptidase domain-containing ABC transporter [Sediminibacterium sp.]|nr:peptidase domain-containing ABC transporter [Sediminibacterium sp.]
MIDFNSKNFMNFPFYKQFDTMDCGPTCLKMIAKFYGKECSVQSLREKSQIQRDGVSLLGISMAAELIGFQCLAVKLDFEKLKDDAILPCIAHWEQGHFVVIYKISEKFVWIADPGKSKLKFSKNEFINSWISSSTPNEQTGIVLMLEPSSSFIQGGENEDIRNNGFWRIFDRFKKYQKLFFQILGGILLGAGLQSLLPFLSKTIVDVGITNKDLDFVTLVLIGQIFVLIGTLTTDFIKSWILLFISQRVNIELLTEFFIKLMKLPLSFFDTKLTGDIMQRMSDHTRLQGFVTTVLLNTSFALINFLIFSIIISTYDIVLFLIYLLGSVVYFLWILIFFKERRKLDYIQFDLSAKNQNAVLEIVQGMQEIKLNNSANQRRAGWESIQAKLMVLKNRALSITQLQTGGGQFINHLKNLFITFWVAREVIHGNMTLGGMIAVQYIIGQLNTPLIELVQFIQSYQEAKISFDRIDEIQQLKDEEPVDQSFLYKLPEDHTIRVSHLSFKYPGHENEHALIDVNLTINMGKVTAVVGASGSGKTTLLKLLLQIYDLPGDEIIVGNCRLKNISPSFWRSRCGVVTQEGYIFSDTIQNNIAIGDEYPNHNRIIEAIQLANLSELINELPLGLNTKIGQQGNGLSQGQKQRILIARAIYKNPDYILFDEATNALDANNELTIMNNLQKYLKGKTAIIVAHRLSTVKNADQIIVLEKGKIVEVGTHALLTSQRGY